MKIPVFVSMPTLISPEQEVARGLILKQLTNNGLEARNLGSTDYPQAFPLREVLLIIRRCSGGVILGFEQFRVETGVRKRGTADEKPLTSPVFLPSPWNQLEAGMLFSYRLPLLVFREPGITGGVFDDGVSDLFLHPMPTGDKGSREGLKHVFARWAGAVRDHYYSDGTSKISPP